MTQKMNKLNPIYFGVTLAFINISANSAPMVWTDADFVTSKGHTWVNSGNLVTTGDLHIQNTKTAKFSGTVANTGVLSVEAGAKLVADGHVEIKNTGSQGDALLVVNGSKAYLNGGLTSIVGDNNGYYSTAVNGAGSELHIVGQTNIYAPENGTGFGLYLGQETKSTFDGNVNIYSGRYGIQAQGKNVFMKNLDVTMTGNNPVGIVSTSGSAASQTDFNGLVNINLKAIGNNTSSSYGIVNANKVNVFNLNEGLNITFNDSFKIGNAHGIYSQAGAVNIKNGLKIHMPSLNGDYLRVALWATNASKINVTNSVVDIKGDLYSSLEGNINIDMDSGSFWQGASYKDTAGAINIKATQSTWNMTGSSSLTNFNATDSEVHFQSAHNNYRTLSVDHLAGEGNTFDMNVGLGDISTLANSKGERVGVAGVNGDLLKVNGSISGIHKLSVTNVGGAPTQGNEVLQIVSTSSNGSAKVGLAQNVELGGYKYTLRETKDDSGNKVGWELYSKKEITDPGQSAVNGYLNTSYLLNYIDNHTLLQRMGELHANQERKGEVWVRAFGGRLDSFDGQKVNGFDMNYAGGQMGADKYFSLDKNHLYGGLMGSYIDADPSYKTGSGTIKNSNIGAYATYFTDKDFYIDANVKYSHISNKFSVKDTQKMAVKGKTSGDGYGFSLETGKRFNFSQSPFYLEPQAQLSYFHQEGSTNKVSNNLVVDFSNYNSILGRVSTIAGYEIEQGSRNKINIYAKLGLVREFDGKTHFSLNGSKESYSFKGNWFEGGLGVSANIKNNHNIYGEFDYAVGNRFDKKQFNLGYRYQF